MSDDSASQSRHAESIRQQRLVMDQFGVTRSQARTALREFAAQRQAVAERRAVEAQVRGIPEPKPVASTVVESKRGTLADSRGATAPGVGGVPQVFVEVTVSGALNGVAATCVFYATAPPV